MICPGTPSGAGSTIGPFGPGMPIGPSGVGGTGTTGGSCTWRMPVAGTRSSSRTTITPDLQAPPLPPHAWPTYAPYNNASRIAYPQAYPYNAFPFIGPYYPFPKVPLGWRKVTLEWEDGHWYLGRNSAPHDYWRVRFW